MHLHLLRTSFQFLSITIIAACCRKDIESPPVPTFDIVIGGQTFSIPTRQPWKRLSKVVFDTNNSDSIYYNSNGQIAIFKQMVASPVINEFYGLQYDASNKLSAVYGPNGRLAYNYTNGQLTEIDGYDLNNNLTLKQTYSWTNNKITEQVDQVKNGSNWEPGTRSTFSYNSDGELTNLKRYNFDPVSNSYELINEETRSGFSATNLDPEADLRHYPFLIPYRFNTKAFTTQTFYESSTGVTTTKNRSYTETNFLVTKCDITTQGSAQQTISYFYY